MNGKLNIEAAEVKQERGTDMKKVLIIAYAFPPAGYVGSLRTLKFCKYLPSFGWQPIVLTVNYTSTEYRDENALKQVPKEAIVYRTFDCDPTKWLNRRNRRQPQKTDVVTRTINSIHKKPATLAKLKKFIFQLISTPDIHVFWIPFALVKSIWIMLQHKIDVIFCSSPPHSSHIIALFLSKLFRKPYLADFRDPWVASSIKRSNSKFLLCMDRYLEKTVFKRASKIITVSDGVVKEMRKSMPESDRNRFQVINNGYDVKDFEIKPRLGPSTNSTKLIVTHTGTLYKGIADEFFLNAVKKLSNEKDLLNKLEIRLIGYIPGEYQKTIQNTNVGSIVKYLGYKTHSETLKYMLESDVLLLLMGEKQYIDGILPVKLFEYMYARKPILAITSENEASIIIRKSNLGIIIDPQDVIGLKEVIGRLYNEKRERGYLTRVAKVDYIRNFERKKLTKRLASVLEDVFYTRS